MEVGPDKGHAQPKDERHGRRLEGPLTHCCTSALSVSLIAGITGCEEPSSRVEESLMETMHVAIVRRG